MPAPPPQHHCDACADVLAPGGWWCIDNGDEPAWYVCTRCYAEAGDDDAQLPKPAQPVAIDHP